MKPFDRGRKDHQGFLVKRELFFSARYVLDGGGFLWDMPDKILITSDMLVFPVALDYWRGWNSVNKEFQDKSKNWFIK